MSKRDTLIILGLTVAILPFLGFPSSWDRVLAILIGITIAIIAYRLSYVKKNSASTPPSVPAPGRRVDDIQSGRTMSYVDHRSNPTTNSATNFIGTDSNPGS